jgi:hypothetical protein
MQEAAMALERELEYYKSIKDSLLQRGAKGKFAVIRGDELLDVFETYEDALKQGLNNYGNTAFLIEQVSQIEEIKLFYHGVETVCPA